MAEDTEAPQTSDGQGLRSEQAAECETCWIIVETHSTLLAHVHRGIASMPWKFPTPRPGGVR